MGYKSAQNWIFKFSWATALRGTFSPETPQVDGREELVQTQPLHGPTLESLILLRILYFLWNSMNWGPTLWELVGNFPGTSRELLGLRRELHGNFLGTLWELMSIALT